MRFIVRPTRAIGCLGAIYRFSPISLETGSTESKDGKILMNFDQSILTQKPRYLMSTHVPMVAVHTALLLTFVIAATIATEDAGKAPRNVVSESPWPWSVPIGLGISQTALLGTFASLAHASFFYRIRWTFRLLALQWICFSVPLLAVVKQRPLPWCLLISELSVLLGAFLVGLMVRWVLRRRLTFEGKDPTKIRNVSSLMDLFVLMTKKSIRVY